MNLYLFGAGASFGSLDCTPGFPALAPNLFDALVDFGGIASEELQSDDRWRSIFRADFETAMTLLFRIEDPSKTHRLLRDLSRYFVRFGVRQGSLYLQLINYLIENKKRFILSTTNYDLLIEKAVFCLGRSVNYGDAVSTDAINIRKLHGSCNFLPDMTNISIQGVSVRGKIDVPIQVVWKDAEVVDFCNSQSSISPAVAMFAHNKPVRVGEPFIHRIQKAWQREVRRADRIFVIGLSINRKDEHIWGHLAKTPAALFYGSKGQREVFESWKTDEKKISAHWLGDTFEEALPKIKTLSR